MIHTSISVSLRLYANKEILVLTRLGENRQRPTHPQLLDSASSEFLAGLQSILAEKLQLEVLA